MVHVGVRASTGTVDGLLTAARARLQRLVPEEAAAAVEQGAVLVDVRTFEQRRRDGTLPHAVAIALNVLEWRADVTCSANDPALGNVDTPLIVVCNEGYCSSLAAARLLDVGRRATDVVGGFTAWRDAGLPVVTAE